MAGKRELKVALIGHRFMGKAHTHAFTDLPLFFDPKATVVKQVICARSEDLPEISERWGWHEWEHDWRNVVHRPDIDIIDIAAPSLLHKDIVLEAARSGKHILCEKPLAMNLSDAKQMLEVVRQAGIVHMVGFNYRKVPAIAFIKRLIEAGELGDIRHFRGTYSQDWLVDERAPLAWRLRKKDAGAGASWDLGAHIVDLARYLVGEIEEVIGNQRTFVKQRPLAVFEQGLKAVAGDELGEVDVDDATSFLANFKNGAMGLFEATRYATGHRNRNFIEIYGSKGAVIFNMERMNELDFYAGGDAPGVQGFRTIRVGEDVHPYMADWWPAGHIIGFGDTFVHEVLDFVNAVADQKPCEPDFYDGFLCQAVLEAVDVSIEKKRWISIEEVVK